MIDPAPGSFAPIVTPSRYQEVYDRLRAAILSGALAPGARLTELGLARQFGTSQAPVREALRRLEQEGLARAFPRRGTYVTRLTREEVEEVYSLRAELEAYAVRRYIERADPDALARPRQLLGALREAARRDDQPALVEADLRFHRALCDGAGNALLSQVWSPIDGRVRGMMAVGDLLTGDLARIAELHLPLVEAIEARDAPRAEAALREHLRAIWIETGFAVPPASG